MESIGNSERLSGVGRAPQTALCLQVCRRSTSHHPSHRTPVFFSKEHCPLFQAGLSPLMRIMYCSGVWSYVVGEGMAGGSLWPGVPARMHRTTVHVPAATKPPPTTQKHSTCRCHLHTIFHGHPHCHYLGRRLPHRRLLVGRPGPDHILHRHQRRAVLR